MSCDASFRATSARGHRRARRCALGLILGLLSAVGCVPPAAVGQYATAASTTMAQFPSLAGDAYQSCLRFETYRAQAQGDGWTDDTIARAHCAARDSAVARVIGVSRVLDAYFTALAALADDGVIRYDTSFDVLDAALAHDAGLDATQVTAVGGLAKFLASAATDGYRRKQLRRAIATQNENVRVVVGALEQIVGEDFANALDVERLAATIYYRTAIDRGLDREPAAVVLLRDVRDDRLTTLRKKRDALHDYVHALDVVRAGHQQLFDARGKLDSKRLAANLAAYGTQMRRAVAGLANAF